MKDIKLTKEQFTDGIVKLGWTWIDSEGNEPEGIVVKLKNGNMYLVPIDKLYEGVLKVLGGYDVYHMSRIVGYYSRIQNWNPSKIAELADRGNGQYRAEKAKV